jgi:hypothetical protein
MADGCGETVAVQAPKRAARLQAAPVILLVANLFPLVGVLCWGWDAFLLLTLYWMETVLIAFWTIARIALSQAGPAAPAGTKHRGHPLVLAAFFSVHSGLFIGVHFLFLWLLFSDGWPARTGGVLGFFRHATVNEGLWVPLLILFVARGAFLFGDVLLRLLLHQTPARAPSLQAAKAAFDGMLSGLYGRIVAMQFAIILGAWFAIAVGSVAPLVLLIAAKTVVELFWDGGPKMPAPAANAKPPAATMRDGRPGEEG